MELIFILSAYLCPIRSLQKYPAQLCVNVNVKNSVQTVSLFSICVCIV